MTKNNLKPMNEPKTTHVAFYTSCAYGDSCINRNNSCSCHGIMKYTKQGKFYKPIRNKYSEDKVCNGFLIANNDKKEVFSRCSIKTKKAR